MQLIPGNREENIRINSSEKMKPMALQLYSVIDWLEIAEAASAPGPQMMPLMRQQDRELNAKLNSPLFSLI